MPPWGFHATGCGERNTGAVLSGVEVGKGAKMEADFLSCRCLSRSAQHFEHAYMRAKCITKTWLQIVGQSKFVSCLLNDMRDFGVMDMTDMRKQMMLYLKI